MFLFSQKPKTVLKIVRFEEVERLSGSGWILAAVIAQDVPASLPNSVPVNSGSGYPTTVSGTEGGVLREPLFIMERGEEGELASRAREVEFLRDKAECAVRLENDLVSERKMRENETKNLNADISDLRGERDRVQSENWKLSALPRKMEADIAKIRKAIGDLRMNEILAGA